MKEINNAEDYFDWLNAAASCIGDEICANAKGRKITVEVTEEWDENFDKSEYAYEFTLDGILCEECDILVLFH